MLRFKSYLNEAFNIPITEPTDIDAFDTPYDKKELKKEDDVSSENGDQEKDTGEEALSDSEKKKDSNN